MVIGSDTINDLEHSERVLSVSGSGFLGIYEIRLVSPLERSSELEVIAKPMNKQYIR